MSNTALYNEDFQQMVKVEFEKQQVYSKHYATLHSLAPSIANNLQIKASINGILQCLVLEMNSWVLKGETVDEERTVKTTYEVPSSWQVMLRLKLRRQGRPWWVPKFLWDKYVEHGMVSYTIHEKCVTVPAKVTRLCPHADVKFPEYPHLHFALPTRFAPWPVMSGTRIVAMDEFGVSGGAKLVDKPEF